MTEHTTDSSFHTPRPNAPVNSPAPSAQAPETLTLDVVATRGGEIESRHRVHAAVVRADGTLVARAHDPALRTWWRSCAKPFQLLPMLEDGSFDRLGWGDAQLALACASHSSEPEQVAIAAGMLRDLGLSEDALACGPHQPLSQRGVDMLAASGTPGTRLHSNCSGKHAAMLGRALAHGWPVEGYEQEDHPVQDAAWKTVAGWCDVPAEEIGRGVDGCGVTVYSLPLSQMALAYARLGAAAQRGDELPARIVHAMTTQPFMVGGTDRFDTLLMEAGAGRIVCKVGAEGVHSVALVDQGIGIAVKVEDGATRAQYPAVLACLQMLGALPAQLPESLRRVALHAITNTRGDTVGRIFVPGHEVYSHGV